MTTISAAQATVTVSVRHRRMTAYVRIAGEVDIAVEPALGDAIDRLTALAPHTVQVDLTADTFGGASLANFFAQVDSVIPEGQQLSRTALPPASVASSTSPASANSSACAKMRVHRERPTRSNA
jgi:hypothetical protein